ncbi:oxidoreductase NAD-binding domain-containing protein 1 [Trichonephila inaurata madagascariensis]|uniref:Oxidoreductase NAD-binding domain-containing protein 1 n=1 Tax=Trichonephila inaurata madagascariensis TaxID=2747483 RepID=A0A8X7CGJ2_9ARAC|nr:oxidoreductase NAD-binding domain-containing protein 1 [Trichonephila inaurata madagascariensis]
MISKIIESYFHQFFKYSYSLTCQRQIHGNIIQHSSRADFRMAPNVFRQKKIYTAVVLDVFNASSTIKILRLNVKEAGFSFKAGQWVDFYVPGISEVTGYSMTSAPNEAKEKGILELAVKYGKFPPTHWVHNSCTPGEEVQIRVGGDFYYDPLSNKFEAEANLLLVGGGVGINPLVSILCEYRDLLLATHYQTESAIQPGRVHLLYSARTENELVFKDTFNVMEKEQPTLTCQYFVTREQETKPRPGIHYSRVEEHNVADSIQTLGEKTLCYVCGPSTMTDDVANWLQKLELVEFYILAILTHPSSSLAKQPRIGPGLPQNSSPSHSVLG